MVYALIAAVAANAAIVAAFVRHLDRRDRREARETQLLLNRVQAPETAVAQTVAQDGVDSNDLYVPFDDDNTYWQAVRSE